MYFWTQAEILSMSGNQQQFVNFRKDIVVPSDPDNLRMIEEEIENLRSQFEFRDDAFGNVMIATTEAVNNGIIHGNGADPGKNVTVSFESLTGYRFKVTVSDEGIGFNPDSLSDPTAPENLEKPGGRGVFLMRHLADEIAFLDDGRKVEMVFRI